ncbi:MAG: ATP-binding cassette domain-containing protein [Janthinobacterium lividum]
MPDTPCVQVRCRATIGTLAMDMDFTLAPYWTVLFGPSGSGKSSVLRLLAGAWMPAHSAVHFRETDLSRTPMHLRRIGFVAQQPALFPHLDVLGNIRFGCTKPTWPHADAMLALFGLDSLRSARIQTLSGGERQRVALARALAASPRMLLLDEVFTGMHLGQRDDLLGCVRQHCRQHDIPVLSVTHDAVEASLSADEVLRLENGSIVSRGGATEVLQPERSALLRALATS